MTSARLKGTGTAALCALAFSFSLAADSAQADTTEGTAGGLTYVFDQVTNFGPTNSASVDALCPSGTHVLGGGAQLGTGASTYESIWLNTSQPFDWTDPDHKPDDGWRADVWDGSSSQASVLVYAICTEDQPVYRLDDTTATAGHVGVAKALCPSHTRLASGGDFVGGNIDEGHLNSSYPVDGGDPDSKPDDGWRTRGYNRSGADKVVDAHAICARTGHFRYVSSGSFTLNPTTGTGVAQSCPASTHAVGGGVQITGAPADAHIFTMLSADDMSDGDIAPDDLWNYGVFNTGTTKSYGLFAICRV
jgi:hypothetical protein